MTEAQLQAAVTELAHLLGYLVYHTHDSRRSAAGFPDLCLVKGPRLVFAELKSAKGTMSTAQVDWIRALERAGVPVYLWRPDHWLDGDIERALRA